ncbi:RING finger and SPRY domain-containing protein 1 [Tyrophagus putrescentiae]|nr:RING finger and SPRY domain-containing protein 1 [Tyrophagus putrescentiae]
MASNIQHCSFVSHNSLMQRRPHQKLAISISNDYISIRHHETLTANIKRSKSEVSPAQKRVTFAHCQKLPVDKTEQLFTTTDLLCARSEEDWQSIRWSFVLDVFYYEMVIHTDGEMRIGLASEHADIKTRKLGSDPFSIALDGYNRCIWHDGIAFPVPMESQWTEHDVIGVKSDVSEKSVTFFWNGVPIKAPFVEGNFFAVPYFPAASLYEDQQCSINFGKKPFMFSV